MSQVCDQAYLTWFLECQILYMLFCFSFDFNWLQHFCLRFVRPAFGEIWFDSIWFDLVRFDFCVKRVRSAYLVRTFSGVNEVLELEQLLSQDFFSMKHSFSSSSSTSSSTSSSSPSSPLSSSNKQIDKQTKIHNFCNFSLKFVQIQIRLHKTFCTWGPGKCFSPDPCLPCFPLDVSNLGCEQGSSRAHDLGDARPCFAHLMSSMSVQLCKHFFPGGPRFAQ